MSTSQSTENVTSYEIAARLVKLVIFFGTFLNWIASIAGAVSVYQLWNVDKMSDGVMNSVSSKLELGWIAIGSILLIRAIQIAIGWAILMPIEAKIHGINLRDPEFSREVREQSRINYFIEFFSLIVLIVIPLLIAHFRFHYFS